MILDAPRTIELVRLLQRSAGARRHHRPFMPRQQQPDAVRYAYYKAIQPACAQARAAFEPYAQEILLLLAGLPHADAIVGTPPPPRPPARARRFELERRAARARALIDHAAGDWADAWSPDALHEVAKKFGKRTSDFQHAQLARQVQAAIGVSLGAIEKPVVDRLEGFAALNVDLIKTVPERYFDRLRLDVEAAFADGTRPEDLAAQFMDRYEISENDAIRIANDQIGKLYGQLNMERQTNLGVTGYAWRTVRDNRVRDEHVEREGEHFEWSAPPEDGHPGEPINCRCYAEPDLSTLLESQTG